jgi:hypothetical protein
MNDRIIHSCPITKYSIEYIIHEQKYAMMGLVVTDYEHIKGFFSLIRNSIDKLKEQGIIKIRQIVSFEDWENYLKNTTTWKIINQNQDQKYYELECEIDEFLYNYGVGMGL